MTLIRKWMPSPNYSSRSGSAVRLIVIHTAEGSLTIESLANYFANPATDVSSHVGVDDKVNTVGEMVKRGNKAWTQGNFNSVAVSAELCAFAKWSTDEWMKHPNMLKNVAQWIKEEAAHFDIPIVALTDSQAQGSGRGVCQHENLGSAGGGHWDCGGGFPMQYVLDLAKGTATDEGSDDELGYPEWFWDWNNWYLTTDRDPKTRPDAAPEQIPQWAWDGQEELVRIGNRYGMTKEEKDWIDWYNGGKQGPRPDVVETIPDRWWDDQKFVHGQ